MTKRVLGERQGHVISIKDTMKTAIRITDLWPGKPIFID